MGRAEILFDPFITTVLNLLGAQGTKATLGLSPLDRHESDKGTS